MTIATRLTNRDVLLLLSENLSANLAATEKKANQQKEADKIKQQLSNLNHFLELPNEVWSSEEVKVFKVQDGIKLGTLGELIDSTGNFWVHWKGHRVPEPEQIQQLAPVSRQATAGLEVDQEVAGGTIAFFAGDNVIVQTEDDLKVVNISQLVQPPTPTPQTKPDTTKSDHQPPLCPSVLVVEERGKYYKLPKIHNAKVLYSTAAKVRVEIKGKAKSLNKDKVYCLFQPENWDDFLVLYAAFETALEAQGKALLELGRYDKQLAAKGGFKKAPNPLTPLIIMAPDPQDRDAYYMTSWSVPFATVEQVQKHTPQMVKTVGDNKGLSAQAQGFCCPSELHASHIQDLASVTERCAAELVAFLTETLGTYAQAESDPVHSMFESEQTEESEDSDPENNDVVGQSEESFNFEGLRETVWDMAVHYLSDILDTDEKETSAIILTCETDATTHIDAIAAMFPIAQRDFAVPVIREAFAEFYKADAVVTRLSQMPQFSVGDNVQAVVECPIGSGIVAEVRQHTIRVEGSSRFFLADNFEKAVSPPSPTTLTQQQPQSEPKPTETEMWLDPKLVITDAGTQSRDSLTWGQPHGIISEAAVAEYAELMREDLWDFFQVPLPVAYFDGEKYYASDSHHRTEAAKRAGVELVYLVRQGGLFEAIVNSCKSNRRHSKLVFSKSDQRKQIEMFLDVLDRASPEKQQALLDSIVGITDRERSWSSRTIAKFLELGESGYRTVHKIMVERKQKQLAEELKIGERVQLSSELKKLGNFTLLDSCVAGCAARILDKDVVTRTVKVLPEGLPNTRGFARWVKTDAIARLAENVEPFATLPPNWQKGLIVDFCRQIYKAMEFQYLDGQLVDDFWIARVCVQGVNIKVLLNYNTALIEVEQVSDEDAQADKNEQEETTQDEIQGTQIDEENQEEKEEDAQQIEAQSAIVNEDNPQPELELSADDVALSRTIGDCFETLDFGFIAHIETWLGQASTPALEQIAQGAEQLLLKVKAALNSR